MARPRILVASDDMETAEQVRSSLVAEGYAVDTAARAGQVFERFGRQPYDLLIASLQLPELDGPALYWALRQRWPSEDPRVIFLAPEGRRLPSSAAGLGGPRPRCSPLRSCRAPCARWSVARWASSSRARHPTDAPRQVIGPSRRSSPRFTRYSRRGAALAAVKGWPHLAMEVAGMIGMALRVLIVLGYLVGRAESKALGDESAALESLGLFGLVLVAVLLFMAFSGAIIALFSRGERRKNGTAGHLSMSDLASAATEPGQDSPDAPKTRPS